MENLMTLTDEEISKLTNATNKKLQFNKITGIKLNNNYNVGDTAVSIDNVEKNTVYKSVFKNKVIYYIIIKVMDTNLGFAYSFYPLG